MTWRGGSYTVGARADPGLYADDELLEFPEYPLWTRYKRAFDWTPTGLGSLLDAGCAWGYGTRFFTTKARTVSGIDPNSRAINIARRRYPQLTFVESSLESTPFDDESFEAIVCCDTLEHVRSETRCLSEMWRVLKAGGVVTLTVPHRGLLGFLDPDNYATRLLAWMKHRMPRLYRAYRRHADAAVAAEDARDERSVDRSAPHRHYTVTDIRTLLDQTEFRGNYEICRLRRSGFLVEMLAANIHFYLKRFLRGRKRATLENALAPLVSIDYRIPYYRLANNMALQIVKHELPAHRSTGDPTLRTSRADVPQERPPTQAPSSSRTRAGSPDGP
jgi:ubiquinone/menaquinone biosynthesis C-methylase UbiE